MTYSFNFDGSKRDVQAASYDKALRVIPYISDREIVSISPTYTKGKGQDGRSYRDFLVDTKLKGTTEKVIYLKGEFFSEIIRVYGSFSGRSLSL